MATNQSSIVKTFLSLHVPCTHHIPGPLKRNVECSVLSGRFLGRDSYPFRLTRVITVKFSLQPDSSTGSSLCVISGCVLLLVVEVLLG